LNKGDLALNISYINMLCCLGLEGVQKFEHFRMQNVGYGSKTKKTSMGHVL
jgi:hypothetical protein